MSDIAQGPSLHRAYPALSRPLTLLGCERRLFLGAACVGAAAFSSFNAPFAGIVLFGFGYGAGLLATRHDPCLPAVLLRSASCGRRYDPALRDQAAPPLEVVGEVSS